MFSSTFQNVVGMSLILGATSYGVGLGPLCMPLSKKQLAVLSNLGTGLLIGTALGVIIPEGIEELVADASWEGNSFSFNIGIPIVLGFAFMFLLGVYTTSHGVLEERTFDVGLEERGHLPDPENSPSLHHTETSSIQQAYPLSFGLIIHALVDGYALGVSASNANAHAPSLSFIVFLAIIVHKAPTALALTTSLLANSLSTTDCKKHLLCFSLATPVSSILSYGLYALHSENGRSRSGSALLFSAGTFLYVASMVQPVSGHASESPAHTIGKTVRAVVLVSGMFFPVLVSRYVAHGH